MPDPTPSLPEAALRPEEAWCGRLGWKLTGPRRIIIRAVRTFSGYFDAEELLACARGLQRGIARATVYRTLSVLVAERLLHATEFGDGHHRYCVHNPSAPPMAEIFVEDCGRVVQVPAPFLSWYAAAVTNKAGFELVGQRLQTFARCRSKQASPDACGSCVHREQTKSVT